MDGYLGKTSAEPGKEIQDVYPSFLALNFATETFHNTHCYVEFNSSKLYHTKLKGPGDEQSWWYGEGEIQIQ